MLLGRQVITTVPDQGDNHTYMYTPSPQRLRVRLTHTCFHLPLSLFLIIIIIVVPVQPDFQVLWSLDLLLLPFLLLLVLLVVAFLFFVNRFPLPQLSQLFTLFYVLEEKKHLSERHHCPCLIRPFTCKHLLF
ncbi:hypothetical protein F5Y16DRAFT_164713 [Xylariaceae sp. FL0255]|nr:hypothetical protein F5Y16DRAFT_164713 [Xylariaceae sp. FL0255]